MKSDVRLFAHYPETGPWEATKDCLTDSRRPIGHLKNPASVDTRRHLRPSCVGALLPSLRGGHHRHEDSAQPSNDSQHSGAGPGLWGSIPIVRVEMKPSLRWIGIHTKRSGKSRNKPALSSFGELLHNSRIRSSNGISVKMPSRIPTAHQCFPYGTLRFAGGKNSPLQVGTTRGHPRSLLEISSDHLTPGSMVFPGRHPSSSDSFPRLGKSAFFGQDPPGTRATFGSS
jgi:hypothetical protein